MKGIPPPYQRPHGHGHVYENPYRRGESRAYAQGFSNAGTNTVTDHHRYQVQQQMKINVPDNSTHRSKLTSLGPIPPTQSSHSMSSIDTTAEMQQYFPDNQTSKLSSQKQQRKVQGQQHSTTTQNNSVKTGITPKVPVPISDMSQQEQQARSGPNQRPTGIPSYASQMEALSVAQSLVNDVLVDLQAKVINETVAQFPGESSEDIYLEPLPPINIQAPQPTIVLQSDLGRLRAELNSRVRPPVIYRYPANGNQYQQNQFQENRFETSEYPSASHTYMPSDYSQYANASFSNSGEYATPSTSAEQRKENEYGLYHHADSAVLNDSNVNDNVQNAFESQGLSTTSFDRHASSYPSSSFLPHFEDHQSHLQEQGNGDIQLGPYNINTEQSEKITEMFSSPARTRSEVTFDIENCILRCFESHRQTVARRRAAKQARKARRNRLAHQQSGQSQYQSTQPTDQYQYLTAQPAYSSYRTLNQHLWQPTQNSSAYTNIIESNESAQSAIQIPTVSTVQQQDYSDQQTVSPTTGLIQQTPYEDTQRSTYYDYSASNQYAPYSSVDGIVPTEIENLRSEYYQQDQQQTSTDYVKEPSNYQQSGEAYNYSDASATSQITNYDFTNYEQQSSGHGQPTGSFEYSKESYQQQMPIYNYQDIEQNASQYSYSANENQLAPEQTYDYTTADASLYIPTESNVQQPTFDYNTQIHGSSNYYQDQPTANYQSQVQSTRAQPSGTFEYTSSTYQSQEPIYNYQDIDQQTNQYTYDSQQVQQDVRSSSYNYETVPDSSIYSTTDSYQAQGPIYNYQNLNQDTSQYLYNGSNQPEQQQFTYSTADALTSLQNPVSVPISQTYDKQQRGQRSTGAAMPTGTIEYTRQSYFVQEPVPSALIGDQIASYQTIDQIDPSDHLPTTATTTTISGSYIIQDSAITQQPERKTQNYDLNNYVNEALGSDASQTKQNEMYEEGKNSLLQQNYNTEHTETLPHKGEELSEIESSSQDTMSSLPPPPIVQQLRKSQEQLTKSITEFPPPPPPLDHTTLETMQQETSRLVTSNVSEDRNREVTSKVPEGDKSDGSSKDDEEEIEESFDLGECIAKCYDKYREVWNEDEKRLYQQQFTTQSQPTSTGSFLNRNQTQEYQTITQTVPICDGNINHFTNISSDAYVPLEQRMQTYQPDVYNMIGAETTNTNECYYYPRQMEQYHDNYLQSTISSVPSVGQTYTEYANPQYIPDAEYQTNTLHYTDGWSQTLAANLVKKPDVIQSEQGRIASQVNTTTYQPRISKQDQTKETTGHQTIEYSPPLITQTRQATPPIHHSASSVVREDDRQEKQQGEEKQEIVFDHISPVPPHLSFNDINYPASSNFSSQITAQPRHSDDLNINRHSERSRLQAEEEQKEQQQQQQRHRTQSEPLSIQQETSSTVSNLQPFASPVFENQPRRSASIPMINNREQQAPPVSYRLINDGRAYETESTFTRQEPRIDPKTGLCLVPCPLAQKYAHLPPHLRPEVFCIELPPPGSLPPPPPPEPYIPQPSQDQRWCVRCCCTPGRSLIKKVVYRQQEGAQESGDQSEFDYPSMVDQMGTQISVRYGNDIMHEGEAFVSGGYNEQLRVIDFPVYVSGQNDPNLTPLVPTN